MNTITPAVTHRNTGVPSDGRDRREWSYKLHLRLDDPLPLIGRHLLSLLVGVELLPQETVPTDTTGESSHVRQCGGHEQDHRKPPTGPRRDIGEGPSGVEDYVDEPTGHAHVRLRLAGRGRFRFPA